MSTTEMIRVLAAGIGALGFAGLFNVRGVKLLAVTLGGSLAWSFYILLSHFLDSEMLRYFIVAMSVSFYGELMARVLKSPAIVFITPCLMPMVPGASLYYTMSHALNENMDGFLEKGGEALRIAAAIAIGVIVVTVIMRFITNCVWHYKGKHAAVVCAEKPFDTQDGGET